MGKLRIALLGAGLAVMLAGSALKAHAETIRIGSITESSAAKIAKEKKRFEPLLGYLRTALEKDGIEVGELVTADSVRHMAGMLQEGRVDFYVDSPFTAIALNRLAGSKLFLRRWKKGAAEYHTVFFTKAGSSLGDLKHLNGKMIAFEEPFSSSGYLLPKMMLETLGYKMTKKATPDASVAADEVGYVFSGEDELTAQWVAEGKVDLGALDNVTFEEQLASQQGALRELEKTFDIPRHLIGHRGGLSDKTLAAVREALLDMDKTEAGREALKAFQKTVKFDEIPADSMTPLLRSGTFIEREYGLDRN